MVAISTFTPTTSRPALRLVTPSHRPPYRARRLAALLVLGAALVLAALGVDAALDAFATSPERPVPVDASPTPPGPVHVVQPGDTLWTIAASVAPDDDPRAVVDRLVELNGSASLQVGEQLVLP